MEKSPRPRRLFYSSVVVFLLVIAAGFVANWGGDCDEGEMSRITHGLPWTFASLETLGRSEPALELLWEMPPRSEWRQGPFAADAAVVVLIAVVVAAAWQYRRARRTRLFQFSLADALLGVTALAGLLAYGGSLYRDRFLESRIAAGLQRQASGASVAGRYGNVPQDWLWQLFGGPRDYQPEFVYMLSIASSGRDQVEITAPIAADLGGLRRVARLHLNNVRIAPAELRTALRSQGDFTSNGSPAKAGVVLRDCDASDEHLETVSHSPKTGGLFVHGGRITDEGVAKLARLPELQGLAFSRMPAVRGHTLRELIHVQTLVLEEVRLDRAGLQSLAAMPALEELSLESCDGWESNAWSELSSAAGLKSLRLQKMTLTDTSLAEIAKLPRLQRLTLVNCDGITPRGWEHAARNPTLDDLRIEDCGFTDESLAALAGAKLSELMIHDSLLSGRLDALENLPQLRRFACHFATTAVLNSDQVEYWRRKLPRAYIGQD